MTLLGYDEINAKKKKKNQIPNDLTILTILPYSVKQIFNAASRFPNFTFLINLLPSKKKESFLTALS